jgi:hypothetical protein
MTATVQIFAGTLDLPQRSPNVADAKLAPFPEPETAAPEKPTILHRDGVRIDALTASVWNWAHSGNRSSRRGQ